MTKWKGHESGSPEAIKAAEEYEPPEGVRKEGPSAKRRWKGARPGTAKAKAKVYKPPKAVIKEAPPQREPPKGIVKEGPAPLKGGADRKATREDIEAFEREKGIPPIKERTMLIPPMVPPKVKKKPWFKIEIKPKPKPTPPGPDREELRPWPKTEMPGPKGYVNEKGIFVPFLVEEEREKAEKSGKLVSFTTSSGKEVRFRVKKLPRVYREIPTREIPTRRGMGNLTV